MCRKPWWHGGGPLNCHGILQQKMHSSAKSGIKKKNGTTGKTGGTPPTKDGGSTPPNTNTVDRIPGPGRTLGQRCSDSSPCSPENTVRQMPYPGWRGPSADTTGWMGWFLKLFSFNCFPLSWPAHGWAQTPTVSLNIGQATNKESIAQSALQQLLHLFVRKELLQLHRQN